LYHERPLGCFPAALAGMLRLQELEVHPCPYGDCQLPRGEWIAGLRQLRMAGFPSVASSAHLLAAAHHLVCLEVRPPGWWSRASLHEDDLRRVWQLAAGWPHLREFCIRGGMHVPSELVQPAAAELAAIMRRRPALVVVADLSLCQALQRQHGSSIQPHCDGGAFMAFSAA